MKNLIESIKNMYQPQAEATMMQDNGKMVHNCAKHVEHRQWGQGATIAEEHADPDRYGNIAWYDIQFPHGIEKGVPISELRVLQAESHHHPAKKAKKMAEAEDLSMVKKNGKMPAEVEDDETDMEDDAEKMPKKAKKGVAEERTDEAMSHQAKTTMKHIPNPSPALKKAAKDIKPGIAGIRDRFDMLRAGGVKGGPDGVKEEAEIDEAYQTAKSEFVARQGRLTAAAAETEKDPVRLKRMSNIPGYSAAMDLAKKTTQGAKHTKEEADTVEFSLTEEEWDQLDELSKSTLGSYVKKSSRDSRITRKIAADFENRADRARSPGMKAASNELSDRYKSKSFKRQAGLDKAVDRLTKEEVESVDETVIHADRSYELDEAQKTGNYDAHFKAHMKKHGVKHPGELDTTEKKKAFFNAVDASYKAKNESVFVEAYMTSDIEDVMTAHKKAGNRISNETSGTRDGKSHHSFVVTTPEGKRTRHIYHGTTKKLESMSPAKRSKQSQEQDLDDKD